LRMLFEEADTGYDAALVCPPLCNVVEFQQNKNVCRCKNGNTRTNRENSRAGLPTP
jgi:hypothetical protein